MRLPPAVQQASGPARRPGVNLLPALALVATALWHAGCAGPAAVTAAGHAEIPARPVEIPMGALGKSPVVPVFIDGHGPFRFIFDTGAFRTVVTPEIVAAVKAASLGGERVLDPGGRSSIMPVVMLPTLTLGEAIVRDVPALVVDLGPIGIHAGEPIHGIVGLPPFADLLVTIDYPAQLLTLEPGSLPEPDGREVLRYGMFKGQLPTLPLQVGSLPMNLVIDTGSDRGVELPVRLATRLDWSLTPVALEGRTFTVAGMRPVTAKRGRLRAALVIGTHAITQPVVDLDRGSLPSLGGAVLEHFRITFDQRQHLVRISRQASGPVAISGLRRAGVELGRVGADELVIGAVGDRVPADAGVRVGDRVLAINGRPAVSITTEALRQIIETEDALDLLLERDGTAIRAQVPILDLLPPAP